MSNFPYPGLRSFKREEYYIFFGRDQISNQLIEKLGNTHFIAVVGISGCGKSSLVRTGLLSALERGLLASAGIHWRIAELHPGNRPFSNLAKALLVDTVLKKEYTAHLMDDAEAAKHLEADLNRGPFSLHEILQEKALLPPQTNLLLMVDQFEELFRHYQQGEENETEKFINLLLKSSKPDTTAYDKFNQVYVVITMRSDFINDCAQFYDLSEAINKGVFVTPYLTREQLHEAIEEPAKVFGGQVEPSLTTKLLNEFENKTPDQLPVLQHALMRMWTLAEEENYQNTIITLKHYEQIGGAANALSKHADKAYDELLPNAQKNAEIMFRRLCERDSASRDTRTPVKLEEIAKLADVPWQQLVQIVDTFRKSGRDFLTPPHNIVLKPDSLLDISHESLIQHWKRLKNWSEEEAKSADMYRRLEDTARRREQEGAALWHELDLENALAWRDKELPNALWASRYGQDFDLAMHFLTESENEQKRKDQEQEARRQQQEKEKKEKEAQQQNLRQARKQRTWLAAGFVVVVILFVWGFIERNNAELEKLNSQLNTASWSARLDNYQKSDSILNQINESDQNIPVARRHTYNLLNWFNQLRGSGSEYVYDAEVALFAVAISSDGKLLAAAGEKGSLVLFDANNGQLLQRLQGHTKHVKTVVFHSKAQWLASAGDDKQIIFWSLPSGKIIKQWQAPNKVRALAISPDNKYLVSGGTDKNISLWNFETDQISHTFKGHKKLISDIAFSPNGELLASASYDDTSRLWQLKTGQTLHTLIGHTENVQKISFSPDGKLLASSSRDKSVRIWAVDSGKTLRVLLGHKKTVFGVRFVADGRYLVSASDDRSLRLWHPQSGVTMRVLQAHKGGVFGIATNGNKIFSASNDGTVRRWNTTLPYQQIVDLPNEPSSTAIAPDGNKVALGFADGALRLYALPKASLLWELTNAHSKHIQNLAFNSDGTLLASASFDHTAKVWQVKKGLVEQQSFKHKSPVNDVSFSPTGDTIATIGVDGRIGLFNIKTAQKRFYQAYEGVDVNSVKEKYLQKYVNSVSYHPNGSQLLTTSNNKVRRWNLNDNSLLREYTPTSTQDKLKWSSFSPNGQQIASVGRDQLVHIYSTIDNKSPQYSLAGHENTIYRVIFSPDSQQVATVSSDATLRLWDLYNGSELFAQRLPTNSGWPVPLRDFDFRCLPQGDCWIAVPLTRGKLILYELKEIYNVP